MAVLELVAPPKTVELAFAVEPAHNMVNSFLLLTEYDATSGLDPWVSETGQALSPELRGENSLILHGLNAPAFLDGRSWPSFVAWVDDLAGRDPVRLRDAYMAQFVAKAEEKLGKEIPHPADLLADGDSYVTLVRRLVECKNHYYEHDYAVDERAHDLLNDPPAMRERMVTHLRQMWDQVGAAEWEHRLPTIEESVAAFSSIAYTGMAFPEALRQVTGRELPEVWDNWEEIDRAIFIPSPHIGPYLMALSLEDGVQRLAFGARLPAGVPARSATLGRSELLIRINALADDTRMRILELVGSEGELSTPQIMAALDLSQSAASRHLHQLSATGYLTARRHEGAKVYRLNPGRISHTCDELKAFCCP